ncbi:iron-containing alcohol dehydrogenase [Sporosarcina sp. Marseille-Q4063]|uniref:iron-containing alcohol dehydrogenase n=1 Tax=Sporosarcina sp. Marseille-Q4063 TaxID=2810514 RepID=UPI001BAE768D|nr:iron-containing alcohol dehydrogenase [Sporosarcina sp. Marseille-Q4063]QUW23224.1 iron-containing alcohol dehydrogenase [Sporosarcina sp. Marseille-Q4063]
MNDFTFYNPVKLIFGKGQLEKLTEELPSYGKKVLVVYGGGSIKKNGLYDEVMSLLDKLGMEVHELAGVEPNPRISTARKGAEICKEQEIDVLLAVGGGSVIDCTKLIACAAKYDGDAWDFVSKKASPKDGLPFGTVLTLAATGSEMNAGSVITNEETEEKYGWGSPFTFPKFSILDPTYTMSVPKDQTVYGIVDMMSHIFEQYFNEATNTPVQDEMCEGVLRAIIENGPKLVEDLENYDLRATILIAGTLGLNNFLRLGYQGDWASHEIEHAISAVYDIPHAGGLAIIFPHWMRQYVDVNPERFARMAEKVFQVNPEGKTTKEVALEGIDCLRSFWSSIGAPETLADYGIDNSKIELMAEKATINGNIGNFSNMSKEDVEKVLIASL